MDRSFLTDIKQEMPPYAARIYSAMVADGSQVVYERFVEELMSRMPNPYNLIDVGCGPGHVTELLAKRLPQGKVIGIDLSDVLIDIAREKRKTLANLEFVIGNALDLPYSNEQFDGAVSVNSIKAWPDQQLGADEMSRIVRSGAKVAVFECDPDCSKEAAQNFCSMWLMTMGLPGRIVARMGRAWHFRRFVASDGLRHLELRELLLNSGLIEVESFSYSDLPFAFAVGTKI